MPEEAQKVVKQRTGLGQDLLHKMKATVTFLDDETQLGLEIPRKILVSYPLSEE